MADQLLFYPYARSELFEDKFVKSVENGRAVATINLKLSNVLPGGESPAAAPLRLHLMGPADAVGLQPSAVVHSAPKPWSRDAETTKLTHVDFGEIDLPWRYGFELRTPGPDPATAGNRPKPWIVLITGTTDELELAGGGVKFKSDIVLAAHDLSQSWKWAHEMESAGRKVARLLSPRGLESNGIGLVPNREYIAAVVPAYALVGGQVLPAWEVQNGVLTRRPEGNALPAYYSWRYWTADAGDFRTLALALHVVDVGGLGTAQLAYERLAGPPRLKVRGAITSLAPNPTTQVAKLRGLDTTWPVATDPAPPPVLADLDALNAELSDPRRPVIGLPTYGIPWIGSPKDTDWGRLLNGDPRFRGIAGLGAWLAMEAQEELIDAARKQVGALAEASQRVRMLAMGLGAARSLWSRRLPQDPVQQLYLFGSTLRRLPASDGAPGNLSAMAVVTGAGRSLPRAALSSAARRLLRPGDGVAKHAKAGAADRAALLRAANQCPPPPLRPTSHVDNALQYAGLPSLREVLRVIDLPDSVSQLIDNIVAQRQPIDSNLAANRLFAALDQAFGLPQSVRQLLSQRLAPYDKTIVTREILVNAVRPFLANLLNVPDSTGEAGLDFVIELLWSTRPVNRPCRPVNLEQLGRRVADAINPMGPNAPALLRVCGSVTGINVCNMEPPEVCIGLNYEVWKLLRDKAKSWLLPGIEDLEKNAVVAMETNPAFVEGLLVGLNTQLLAELRWHNLAIAPKCTPLRWFWGNYDYKTDARVDDIRGIDLWKDTRLGDKQHQVLDPGDPTGNRDLVMLFRSDLFRRYPSTLVYLVGTDDDAALKADKPDFVGRKAIPPRIKGSIGEDVTFFIFDISPNDLAKYRVVLDQPPAELRFRNDNGDAADHGAAFAKRAIDQPIRVVVDGTYLNFKGATP